MGTCAVGHLLSHCACMQELYIRKGPGLPEMEALLALDFNMLQFSCEVTLEDVLPGSLKCRFLTE